MPTPGRDESEGNLEREFSPAGGPEELEPSTALSLVQPGMDVRDQKGDEIGKVVRVYRPVTVDEQGSMTPEAFIRVGDQGLFGLGKDIYIPSSFVTAVNDGGVTLNVDKDVLPDMALDRPYNIANDPDEE
jgi:hypothetical protein